MHEHDEPKLSHDESTSLPGETLRLGKVLAIAGGVCLALAWCWAGCRATPLPSSFTPIW